MILASLPIRSTLLVATIALVAAFAFAPQASAIYETEADLYSYYGATYAQYADLYEDTTGDAEYYYAYQWSYYGNQYAMLAFDNGYDAYFEYASTYHYYAYYYSSIVAAKYNGNFSNYSATNNYYAYYCCYYAWTY